ncbi:MAG TPA: hypothetical protein ENJ27_00745 [Candidatus Moranbacteria bacterium]|nr:hypothetical protein [Candidatus Moranbacteria bacterium]
METLKKVLTSKQVKRAGWTLVNSVMAFIVSIIAYEATQEASWAVAIYPFAHILSQMLTKEINNRK